MIKFFKLNKVILQIIFLYFIFINQAKSLEKIYKGETLSNYFSGVVALSENNYGDSYNFFKSIVNLENIHSGYSISYVESLVNNFKINEAYRYSLNLKEKKLNFPQSDIVVVSKLLKKKKFQKAFYYLNLSEKKKYSTLEILLNQIILNWVKIENSNLNYENARKIFDAMSPRYSNLKKINKVFLSCYFRTKDLEAKYQKLVNDNSTDFSRYTFFYVDYLLKKNDFKKANLILNSKLKKNPRNLLLNQLKNDLEIKKQNFLQNNFSCSDISNIIAELFYITANALSSQSLYSLSNFYLNLAKYLNQDFVSYNTLLAENYFMTGNYDQAKKIYLMLKKIGETYAWHSARQISLIDLNIGKNDEAISLMKKSYHNLKKPSVYQIYDFASFLKNNEKFLQSIKYYSIVINKISKTHELYPKAKDGRGVAFEQINKWDKAEKDFLDSLKVKPDQAYVINYLAYSWIEKGIKIEESLKMLENANELKTNDGYIIDSLGWALFKLKKYKKAKKYLQQAVQLMPSDPIVNDHYADSLWMNGKKIQARYYWEHVLNLKNTKEDLKNEINKKMLKGPSFLN